MASLREAVLNQSGKFKMAQVEIEGNTYGLKQLSVKDRKKVLAKSTDEKGSIDPYEFFIWATIFCTCDPDTGEVVFEETDYEALAEMPAGGIVDTLGAEAAKLLNGGAEGNA